MPGIGFIDPALEEFLHTVRDEREGDELRAGREGKEHGPRRSGKDIPVGKTGKTGNEERHDNETEKNGGAGEGNEEYLEIEETLEGQGPGRSPL